MRALIIVVVVAVASCGGNSKPPEPAPTPAPAPAPAPQPPADTSEDRFTATISEIDFGCAADAGPCSLVADGKRVQFGHDLRGQEPAEWGDSGEVFELMEQPQQGVGRKVEVFAAKHDGGYTLRGKASYYIKVLP